jgi:hypothetical protein
LYSNYFNIFSAALQIRAFLPKKRKHARRNSSLRTYVFSIRLFLVVPQKLLLVIKNGFFGGGF